MDVRPLRLGTNRNAVAQTGKDKTTFEPKLLLLIRHIFIVFQTRYITNVAAHIQQCSSLCWSVRPKQHNVGADYLVLKWHLNLIPPNPAQSSLALADNVNVLNFLCLQSRAVCPHGA